MSLFVSVLPLLVLTLLSATSLPQPADAHSYLYHPHPYTTECKGCNVCPSERKNPSKLHHGRTSPVATWSRGQKVNIKWVKNNHNGGFVRLSLLPLSGTFNSSAIKHFAFYFGCWEQGRYKCRGRECGVDNHGEAFHRYVTIPDNLPDGVYTFAWMWYGGTHFRRKEGLYSDFTSCAYVRIKGGSVLKNSFEPFFEPGYLDKYEHRGLCLTSANAPGQCLHGCDHKPTFYSVPADFKRGKPRPLLADEYGMEMPTGGNRDGSDTQEDEAQVGMPKIPTDFVPGKDYDKYVKKTPENESAGNAAPQPGPTEAKKKRTGSNRGNDNGKKKYDSGSYITRTRTYICNHHIKICCPAQCGECEQKGCKHRSGGKTKCCPSYIRNRSGRKCSETSSPCYYAK